MNSPSCVAQCLNMLNGFCSEISQKTVLNKSLKKEVKDVVQTGRSL